jgi:hypothetical protein
MDHLVCTQMLVGQLVCVGVVTKQEWCTLQAVLATGPCTVPSCTSTYTAVAINAAGSARRATCT